MRRVLSGVLPALIITSACAGDPGPRDITELVQEGDVYLDPETMTPYSGPVIRFFESDGSKIRSAWALKDGLNHGTVRIYHEDGQLAAIGSYVNGKRDGLHESYYAGGQLEGRGTFDLGTGVWEMHHENGQLRVRMEYVDGRVVDGPGESYHPNGEVWSRSVFVDGELDGTVETYYDDGQLSVTATYAGGALDGPLESYHQSGRLESRRNYVGGKLDGLVEWFYEDGQLEVQGTVELGTGSVRSFHPDGQLKSEALYVDGELDGPWIGYDENGGVTEQGRFSKGERCGDWIKEDGPTEVHTPCPSPADSLN